MPVAETPPCSTHLVAGGRRCGDSSSGVERISKLVDVVDGEKRPLQCATERSGEEIEIPVDDTINRDPVPLDNLRQRGENRCRYRRDRSGRYIGHAHIHRE